MKNMDKVVFFFLFDIKMIYELKKKVFYFKSDIMLWYDIYIYLYVYKLKIKFFKNNVLNFGFIIIWII